MDKYLKSVYYDPSHVAGFASVEKLVQAAKAKGFQAATRGTVKQWLLKQETYALSRPARRRFKRSAVVVEGLDALDPALPYRVVVDADKYGVPVAIA